MTRISDDKAVSPLTIVLVVLVVILLVSVAFIAWAVFASSPTQEKGGGSGVDQDNMIGYIRAEAFFHISRGWWPGDPVKTDITNLKATFTPGAYQQPMFVFPSLGMWGGDTVQKAKFIVTSMAAGYNEKGDIEWKTQVDTGASWDFSKTSPIFNVKNEGYYHITVELYQYSQSRDTWDLIDSESMTLSVSL